MIVWCVGYGAEELFSGTRHPVDGTHVERDARQDSIKVGAKLGELLLGKKRVTRIFFNFQSKKQVTRIFFNFQSFRR